MRGAYSVLDGYVKNSMVSRLLEHTNRETASQAFFYPIVVWDLFGFCNHVFIHNYINIVQYVDSCLLSQVVMLPSH